jgi:hypothetical protein
MAARILSVVAMAIMVASFAHTADAAKAPANKKKLKVVLLMGQSNMVGYSRPMTAWYLTQPLYMPPSETATAKGSTFEQGGFYWSGLQLARGDSEEYNARGSELYEERRASRRLWRGRVYGENTGYTTDWKGWKKEWGARPGDNGEGWRGDMYNFLQRKAEAEGIYKRMAEHIDSPENKLHPTVAFKLIADRDKPIADDIKRVRKIFLNGTKPEDFDGLNEQIKSFGGVNSSNRLAYAELVREKVNLPIAEHTYISAYGEVAGAPTDGRLSLGYTKWSTACGPEYPFGISFEQMVDGPVLLIKCAWGGTSLNSNWRPPSLANAETPIEKAVREAANKAGAEAAKKSGNRFTPKEPTTGTGRLFDASLAHIQKVLADPGKYHPDYEPKEGYEIAGLVWFQGWNDSGNQAYGEQLVHFIKDWRKELKAPDMPVVCGLLGHKGWKRDTFAGDVNKGMLYAAKNAELKGTVDVVNTLPYMPLELGMLGSVKTTYGAESEEYKNAERIIKRATSKDGSHYFGSAKFIYLTGDAMARKLANLMAGGEPTIFAEAEALGVPPTQELRRGK